MEDALVHEIASRTGVTSSTVLILVLMEDALVQHLSVSFRTKRLSLNPCFNGRCTSTDYAYWH